MNRLITFLFSLVLVAPQAWGQASLLPNAKQQFVDNAGAPLAIGTVDLFVPNTNTRKNSWTNAAESSLNTNPVTLDAGGRAIIYGQGSYRQVVKDATGNTIWDQVTAAPASGTSTFLTDGAPIGTMLPYAGITLPTNYLWAYGQALSRTTYAGLYNATTIVQTATTIVADTTVAGLTDTSQMKVGAFVEGTCFPAGTTVSAIFNIGAFGASAGATSTGSCTIRVFPYGHGDGSTTFNAPDMRGVVPAGRDNLGGTAASRLTNAYCTAAGGLGLGSLCGSQLHTMTTAEMVAHTHTGTTNGESLGHSHSITIQQSGSPSPIGAGQTPMIIGGTSNTGDVSNDHTHTFTTASTGSTTAFSIVQPTAVVNYIIKYQVTDPGDNGGVVSLGGMTGDILCGTGLVCSGGTVSSTALGTGDVVGPASSVNNRIAVFSGTTGKLIADSGTSIATVANAITQLSGDITAIGPGSVTATLPTINANTGAFGSTTAIPNFTVNGKGQILAAGTNVVIAPAGTLTGATLAANVLSSSLTGVGTLTSGTWNATTIAVANGGTGLTAGTSGGVLAFTGAGTLASSGALTANLPVIGGGAGSAPTVGTRSGNTTTFATATGTLTSGHCVSIDGSGNFIDAGGACTTGGGGGTVSAGTAGQLGYYATSSTIISGNANVTASAGAVTHGQAGSVIGQLLLAGNTSGTVTVTPQAAAGTFNFNLPTAAGTAGQPLLSGGGGAAAQTYGTLGVAAGGTGLTSGTSGGIPAFTASGTLASSGALTANLPVIGGGAGVAPSVGTRSGNTTAFVTTTGSLTSGRCVQIDASGNFIQASGVCNTGTVTSIIAGTGLTGGTITTTGTVALDLTRANTWTGALTTSSDALFKNGRPWADVKAWGAACDGATDDTTAITNAIGAVNTNGGVVFFPPMGGFCKVTSGLTISGSVCLIGVSPTATGIIASTDFTIITFTSAVNHGCIEKLGIYGYQNIAAAQVTVFVESNALVDMKDCNIWGGLAALYTRGVDGKIDNCFIAGAGTGTLASSVLSQGANWYVRVKLDTAGIGTTNAFYQAAPIVPGTILENHFTQTDFSGTYTNSVVVEDGAGNSAVMVFSDSVFNSPIRITNAKWVAITGSELGSATFVHSAGTLTAANNYAFGATTLSGAGTDRLCSNNKNITC